jgi:hypothetical protein
MCQSAVWLFRQVSSCASLEAQSQSGEISCQESLNQADHGQHAILGWPPSFAAAFTLAAEFQANPV